MQENLATACVLCSHNCGLLVDVEENRVRNIRPDPNNPITGGYICNKGYAIGDYINHQQRVQHPMRRKADGSFERISWETAFAEIGSKLRGVVDESGPNAFALVGIGGQGNHNGGPFGIGLLEGVGSQWWFNALAQEKSQHGLVDEWMFRSNPTSYFHPDLERSSFVLMMGTNPLVSNRGHRPRETLGALAKDPKRTLVVVDPRKTETTAKADQHLQLKTGSDVFLLMGMVAHLFHEDLVDKPFARAHTRQFEEVKRLYQSISTLEMAKRCGIPHEELTSLTEAFATAKSAAVIFDLGVEQSHFSTLTAYLMRLISTLTGNLGQPGGNVFWGTFAPKTPAVYQNKTTAPVSGISAICIMTPFGMYSPNLLPEEILREGDERIRAVVVEGANPILQYADSNRLRQAFSALDLLVVIEPAMTETARMADYVLPTPVGYEKWEYSGFPKGYPGIYAQIRPPIVQGPAEALPEPAIYHAIAKAAGVVGDAPRILHRLASKAHRPLGAGSYLAALMAAAVAGGLRRGTIARIVFWLYESLGPTLKDPGLVMHWLSSLLVAATRRSEMVATLPTVAKIRNPLARGLALFEELLKHPEGVHLCDLDMGQNLSDHLGFADKRIRLLPPAMKEETQRALDWKAPSDSGYPFILNGGMRTHWNANTIVRNPAWRKGKGPHCSVHISQNEAAALKVADGDMVWLETKRGRVELPVAVDSRVADGTAHVPNGFGMEYPDEVSGELKPTGICINELTDAEHRDPFTGCPYHKRIYARIEPSNASAS